VRNAGCDFIEQGLLGVAQSWFGKKFKVLYHYRLETKVQDSSKFDVTYSCCLEDFAKAGEIVDA
jgi:hypothetical protein